MKSFIALTVFLLAETLFAAVPGSMRKSGEGKIQMASFSEKDKILHVALSNDEVEVTTGLRGDTFFKKFIVNANPEVKNKSARALNVSYHVALFNKAGELVGATAQESDLDPGKKTQF